MIVYFADKQLNILGVAGNTLEGYLITSDEMVESVDTGVNTLSLTIYCNGRDENVLKSWVDIGNFILRESDDNYSTVFQVLEYSYDHRDDTLTIFAEDGGMDFVNVNVPAVKYTSLTLEQMVNKVLSDAKVKGWTVTYEVHPTNTKTIEYTGDNSLLERIKSVVQTYWGLEFYFSFVIEGLNVTKKILNICEKRGVKTPTHTLRMNEDIDTIIETHSGVDMCTALNPTGNGINLKALEKNVTKNGRYYYTVANDPRVYCREAINNAKTKIDSDGIISKPWSYDTTNTTTLFNQTVAYLDTLVTPTSTYDVEIINFPEDARIGDRINIVDDYGELYIEGRILELHTSETSGSVKATLGEFIVRNDGISDIVKREMENIDFPVSEEAVSIALSSSQGTIFKNTDIETFITAKVYVGQNIVIESQSQLEDKFPNAKLVWYVNNVKVNEGFSYTATSVAESLRINVRLEK